MTRVLAAILALAIGGPVSAQDSQTTPDPVLLKRSPTLSAAEANGDSFEVSASAGGIVTFGADSPSAVTPTANIEAEGPLIIGELPLGRIGARVSLTTAPGESLNLSDPNTFRAGDVSLFGGRIIGRRTTYREHDGLRLVDQDITTEAVFDWGFSSRISQGDSEPAQRLVRHYGAGLRFRERTSRASLTVLYGRDEAGGERGWGQWMVWGDLPVPATKGVIVLTGDATLSTGPASTNRAQRDIFRFGVVVDLKQIVDAVSEK